MNGLRYVRIRCNLSMNELAEVLGISRQALSAWESNQKPLPERRCEQLAEFFGIEERFLGEITQEDAQYLKEQAMYRHAIEHKEVWLFRPNADDKKPCCIYFTYSEDEELTIDEQYARAKKRKQETLNKVDEVMRYFDRSNSVPDKLSAINRGCRIYDAVNLAMSGMPNQKNLYRVPYFNEIETILYAMPVAYGLMSEEDAVKRCSHNGLNPYDNSDWLLQLIQMFKAHWDEKIQAMDAFEQEIFTGSKEERQQVRGSSNQQ